MSAVEGDDENVSDEEKDRRRAKAILVLQHGNKRQEQAAR
jgi:hypothetical protein